MKKKVKILQIAVDSSERPDMGIVFGLGDDGKLYTWDFIETVWVLAKDR